MVTLGKHGYRIMALEATDGACSGEGIGINIFLIFNGAISLPLKRNVTVFTLQFNDMTDYCRVCDLCIDQMHII
jgi:hypothetical protein